MAYYVAVDNYFVYCCSTCKVPFMEGLPVEIKAITIFNFNPI